jgi:phosphate starvation-inducible protein PhoH and related proteins
MRSMRAAKTVYRDDDAEPVRIPVTTCNPYTRHAISLYAVNTTLVMIGPGGTGKTINAASIARMEINAGRAKHIVLIRPALEATGEKFGYIPGTAEEKIEPYMRPVRRAFKKICVEDEYDRMMSFVECEAIAHMRGMTYDDSVVILDEAQNCTLAQLHMITTRIGHNTKLIIAGDPNQSDLPIELQNDFPFFVREFTGLESFAVQVLPVDAVKRSEAVRAYEERWAKVLESRRASLSRVAKRSR